MSRRGVRRSISIRVEVFWRLKQLASMSDKDLADCAVVETLIDACADARGVPTISREAAMQALPLKPLPKPSDQQPSHPEPEIVSQHFTF